MRIKSGYRSSVLLPVIGICIYCVLYLAATLLYPGGNEINPAAKGFSWRHNYWCELLATHAENGQINAARPVAITAMIILALSLSLSWYYIPELLHLKKTGKIIIRYCGILSMATLFFLFVGASAHDTVINIAGALGVVAMIITLVGLFKSRFYKIFSLGLLCLILCIANNYIYQSKDFLFYLPVVQKISFLFFLFWFSWQNLLLYLKLKPPYSQPDRLKK